jgi:hypothetical protein
MVKSGWKGKRRVLHSRRASSLLGLPSRSAGNPDLGSSILSDGLCHGNTLR